MSKTIDIKKIKKHTAPEKFDIPDLIASGKEELTHYFRSNFNFLKQQRGIRPGEVHAIVGNSGGGKSTLARSIMREQSRLGKKILVITSEERKRKYGLAFVDMLKLDNLNLYNEEDIAESAEKELQNFLIMEEGKQFEGIETSLAAIKVIRHAILDNKPDILFYDNLSTSKYYDLINGKVLTKNQDEHINGLRKLAEEFNIPIIVMMHPKDESPIAVASTQNIAGSAKLRRVIQKCFWVHQKYVEICGKTTRVAIVQNMKIRKYHNDKDSTFYTLKYEGLCYTRDIGFQSHEYAMKVLTGKLKKGEKVIDFLPNFDRISLDDMAELVMGD